jgi:hypothetical protein
MAQMHSTTVRTMSTGPREAAAVWGGPGRRAGQQASKQAGRQAGRRAGGQAGRQAGRQAGMHADRQAAGGQRHETKATKAVARETTQCAQPKKATEGVELCRWGGLLVLTTTTSHVSQCRGVGAWRADIHLQSAGQTLIQREEEEMPTRISIEGTDVCVCGTVNSAACTNWRLTHRASDGGHEELGHLLCERRQHTRAVAGGQ